MDQGKIGKFISEMRKSKKLTQKNLADKLFISEKTISKWECGKGLPEVSLMLPLCEILGISVNELLSGHKINNDEYKVNAEENFLYILKEKEDGKRRLIVSFITALIGGVTLAIMILISNYIDNMNIKVFLIVFGIIIFLVSFVNAVILDYGIGIYECKNCNYEFKPDLLSYLVSPHTPLKRYLKCPKCKKNSYCIHKLFKR